MLRGRCISCLVSVRNVSYIHWEIWKNQANNSKNSLLKYEHCLHWSYRAHNPFEGFYCLLACEIQSWYDHLLYPLDDISQICWRILQCRWLQLGLVIGLSRPTTIELSSCYVVKCFASDSSRFMVNPCTSIEILLFILLAALIIRKLAQVNQISADGRILINSFKPTKNISFPIKHFPYIWNTKLDDLLNKPMAVGRIYAIDNYVCHLPWKQQTISRI